ncbi:GNAT family N-acetyltransferase [Qipengyuania qiaonensis]|uniref:GNAT family N-acetyltransferase n=1 Tax=Qipengyuania qiaonensis TaxID=2867240 RepID=A0ABS7J9S0_9SPHN|nr:GNAT family N-acetyltransferase [Qipengyuania qiaonensis]
MAVTELDHPGTSRLRFNIPGVSDLDDMIAMWSDPEVAKYIGGKPSSSEEVWQRLLRYRGHWALNRFGYWVVRDQSSDTYVGEVGFADWRRENLPEIAQLPECGWALSPAMQGKGLAREAIEAVLAWSDAQGSMPETVCMIAPGNTRSIELAERQGFREVAEREYKGATTKLFKRTISSGG